MGPQAGSCGYLTDCCTGVKHPWGSEMQQRQQQEEEECEEEQEEKEEERQQ